MEQVFMIMFFVGLGLVLLDFLLHWQKILTSSWSCVRILGYVLVAVSSTFLALIHPNWFCSFEGYACAVAFSWVIPILEEKLLSGIWAMFKQYDPST